MKKYTNIPDKQIQEALDRHTSWTEPGERFIHEDAELYKSIYEILDHQPEINFGDDFTNTIIELAQKRKKVREVFWKIALYAGVSIPLIAVCILTALAMDQDMVLKMAGALKGNSGYLFFGATLFGIIQILDMILIKKKLPHART